MISCQYIPQLLLDTLSINTKLTLIDGVFKGFSSVQQSVVCWTA